MKSPGKAHRIGLVLLAAAGIPLACAETAEPEPPLDEARPLPEAGAVDPGDASPALDAASDAGPVETCSASKLCTTAAPIDETVNITALWGSSASDVWGVGSDSTIVHYDGAKWEKAARTAPDLAGFFTMQSVWLERPDDVWIADGNRLRHTTGWKGPDATEWSYSTFTTMPHPAAIRGHGGKVWVARGLGTSSTQAALWQYDGWSDGGPTAAQAVGPTRLMMRALTVIRPDELWATGPCQTRHCVYRATLPATDGGTPKWGVEEHDSVSVRTIHGIWGDATAVWLVGEGGTLRRMTASALPTKRFEVIDSPVTEDLHGIFGFAADDVWVVGEGSTVLRWDGATWTKLATPFDDAQAKPRLRAVWGSSPRDVWIAGEGTILHYEDKAQ